MSTQLKGWNDAQKCRPYPHDWHRLPEGGIVSRRMGNRPPGFFYRVTILQFLQFRAWQSELRAFIDMRSILLKRRGYLIHTVFIFLNSRIPLMLNSRPWPELFTPPKGTRGSDATIWLIKTIPASNSLINKSRSRSSLAQALAPRP